MQLSLFQPQRRACLTAFCAIATGIGPERLVSAAMRWRIDGRPAGRMAVGCGGGRAIVRGYGATGRGETLHEAAMDWLRAAE